MITTFASPLLSCSDFSHHVLLRPEPLQYVACCGVPEAEPAHAVKMARFAWDCMVCMREITRDLETQLGPDTGELSMRFGLNSGPVTAGLLRGQQSRFQLFGDTVNTAARMESTGKSGKIQCSQSTAQALMRSGKDHWIVPREDIVSAKGKVSIAWISLTCDLFLALKSHIIHTTCRES